VVRLAHHDRRASVAEAVEAWRRAERARAEATAAREAAEEALTRARAVEDAAILAEAEAQRLHHEAQEELIERYRDGDPLAPARRGSETPLR
jgi:hypothetical protein